MLELASDGTLFPGLQPKQFCNFDISITYQRGCFVNCDLEEDIFLNVLLWIRMRHQQLLQSEHSECEILDDGADTKFCLMFLVFLLLLFFLRNLVWNVLMTFWYILDSSFLSNLLFNNFNHFRYFDSSLEVLCMFSSTT